MTVIQGEQELSLRLSREEQQRLEQAAVTTGQSLSEFVTSTLLRTADDVREHGHVTTLSIRDFDRFMEIIEADAEPNEALKAAAEEYYRKLADGSLQTC